MGPQSLPPHQSQYVVCSLAQRACSHLRVWDGLVDWEWHTELHSLRWDTHHVPSDIMLIWGVWLLEGTAPYLACYGAHCCKSQPSQHGTCWCRLPIGNIFQKFIISCVKNKKKKELLSVKLSSAFQISGNSWGILNLLSSRTRMIWAIAIPLLWEQLMLLIVFWGSLLEAEGSHH